MFSNTLVPSKVNFDSANGYLDTGMWTTPRNPNPLGCRITLLLCLNQARAAISTFLPTVFFFTQSEGTYDVIMSTWNPLDGFLNSVETTIQVMERIGPIYIDDYQIVTDHVSKISFGQDVSSEIKIERTVKFPSCRTRPRTSTSRTTAPVSSLAWRWTGATAARRSCSETLPAARSAFPTQIRCR